MRQPGDGVNIDHQMIQERQRESKKEKMTDRRHNSVRKKGLLGANCFHIYIYSSNDSNKK
jgi:hypothetical protein